MESEAEKAHFQPSAWGFLTSKHSPRFANDGALALREKIAAGVDFRGANRANRAPVSQLVEHRAVTREVVSSTPAGTTLRVFK